MWDVLLDEVVLENNELGLRLLKLCQRNDMLPELNLVAETRTGLDESMHACRVLFQKCTRDISRNAGAKSLKRVRPCT